MSKELYQYTYNKMIPSSLSGVVFLIDGL